MIDRIERWWKRHVVGCPDFYQVYVRLPTRVGDADGATDLALAAGARAQEFEAICDGRLDVYGETDAVLVETDFVPASLFDLARFEALLEAIADLYPSHYALRRVERWIRHEGRAAKTFLVSPVEPLFPADGS